MSYRIMNHEMRREIRSHVEASAKKQGLVLEQHTIENLINQRVQAIGREIATGQPQFVDWDGITRRAFNEQQEGKEQFAALGSKLPASWRNE